MKADRLPKCAICGSPAEYLGAQSTDQGETVDWVFICIDHRLGWNEGGDWEAPVSVLGWVEGVIEP